MQRLASVTYTVAELLLNHASVLSALGPNNYQNLNFWMLKVRICFIQIISDVHKDLSSLQMKNWNWMYKVRMGIFLSMNWSMRPHFNSVLNLNLFVLNFVISGKVISLHKVIKRVKRSAGKSSFNNFSSKHMPCEPLGNSVCNQVVYLSYWTGIFPKKENEPYTVNLLNVVTIKSHLLYTAALPRRFFSRMNLMFPNTSADKLTASFRPFSPP